MEKTKAGIDGSGTEGSYTLDRKDVSMSISHLKDTLEYNLRHAEEHLKKAKEACERLRKSGEKPNIPRSLVDLGEYFERKGGYEHQVDADNKLKNYIKRTY